MSIVYVVQEELGGVAVPHLLSLLQEGRQPLQDGGGHTVSMSTWGVGGGGVVSGGCGKEGKYVPAAASAKRPVVTPSQ